MKIILHLIRKNHKEHKACILFKHSSWCVEKPAPQTDHHLLFTLYPLQRFLLVNLDPRLSRISLHTCINKGLGSACVYALVHVLC